MFTVNRMQAAPVVLSKQHLEHAQPQAVVVNSGNANAATGEQGLRDAQATAAATARLLGLSEDQVLVLSTGVIGVPLPVDELLGGLGAAVDGLSPDGGAAAAEAILTTDTCAKEAVAHGEGFVVGGMAKGSGMIHPNLATMLAVVTTDYPLEPGEALEFLRPAVERSFNAISVDGECSTNDTVVLLANGASAAARDDAAFAEALDAVCSKLGGLIVADGEGVTVVAQIGVTGAASADEAKAIARRIATSPLVKTALHGHDANWGRVLAAAGSAPFNGGYARLDPVARDARLRRRARARARGAARCRAGARGRDGDDRPRPRARRRLRELPDERPVVRLRPHQRGLPLVKIVVKIGGAVAGDAAATVLELATEHEVCVVHGAGPQISEEMLRYGLRVEFVDGRRVTSPAALVLVRRSLARVNAELCAALGERAVGLIGDEIGLRAEHVPELGCVGEPIPTRPLAIELALAQALIPVVAPVAEGPLNVNADAAAAALAVGLGAERILFVSDVPGVYLDGAVAHTLAAGDADRLLDTGELAGGIVPKVRAAVVAARLGVRAEIGATAVVA